MGPKENISRNTIPAKHGRGLNRRNFLKFSLRGVLWTAVLGINGLWRPKKISAAAPPDVVVASGPPVEAVRAAVDALGGIGHFVKPGNKVVIKPNMSFAAPPQSATNTHPDVVRELAALCRRAGAAEISIIDNPPTGVPDRCVERVKEACREFGDRMVEAVHKGDQFKTAKINSNWFGFNKTDVAVKVLEADVLIAAPVAKSHYTADVTLSLKGMMGLIWDRQEMHQRGLDSSIVKLAAYLKPDLVVIDATRVLSTNGPWGPGKLIEAKKIIASTNMVAADAQAVRMFEFNGKKYKPEDIGHLRLAHEEGLGSMDAEGLNIAAISV